MYKLKMFSAADTYDMAHRVNKWLIQNPDIKIAKTNQSLYEDNDGRMLYYSILYTD